FPPSVLYLLHLFQFHLHLHSTPSPLSSPSAILTPSPVYYRPPYAPSPLFAFSLFISSASSLYSISSVYSILLSLPSVSSTSTPLSAPISSPTSLYFVFPSSLVSTSNPPSPPFCCINSNFIPSIHFSSSI
ncbi:hypothetical protein OTU49_016450, partial [Cherax quadricarinatus]